MNLSTLLQRRVLTAAFNVPTGLGRHAEPGAVFLATRSEEGSRMVEPQLRPPLGNSPPESVLIPQRHGRVVRD